MKKFAEVFLTISIVLGIQPVLANTSNSEISQTQTTQSATNQMVELSKKWGFKITDCQGNIAQIEHDITKDIACIVPNEKIKAGHFIYDSTNNEINSVAVSPTVSAPENKPSSNNVSTLNKSKIKQVVFTFDNAYDYGACLDTILLAYENRTVELQKVSKNDCAQNILNLFGDRLMKDTALELVKMANNHATQGLEDTLYPSLGLRRRVAINLGYVYDIDKNNQDILKYLK